jgi:tRNA-binding protein
MESLKPAPVKPIVSPEALAALDVRVGTILRVLDVPQSDRLVRLTVDFGDHTRQVVAGIKTERADPLEIEGRQALFVVNLAPKTIRGERSEAMLFDIGFSDGIAPALAVPERTVPSGARCG